MSAASKVREFIMQAGGDGLSTADLINALPQIHHRTVARATQHLAAKKFIKSEKGLYYPPANFPTNYFLDQTLVNIANDRRTWVPIVELAEQVPVAHTILRRALPVLQSTKLILISNDGQYARLLGAGQQRAGRRYNAREIIKGWKPPQSCNGAGSL